MFSAPTVPAAMPLLHLHSGKLAMLIVNIFISFSRELWSANGLTLTHSTAAAMWVLEPVHKRLMVRHPACQHMVWLMQSKLC